MRCTKCGYISFDHLQNCRHCSTNLQELGALLKGTSIQAEPPLFLAALLEPEEEVFQPQEEGEEPVISEDEEEEEVPLSLDDDAAELSLGEEQQETEEESILESVEISEEEAEKEEPAVAIEAEEKEETEMPAALSQNSEDLSEEAPVVAALADVQEEQEEVELSLTGEGGEQEQQTTIPEEMELKDISAPGDNLTAGLEEIDLNDLMGSEEGEEGALGAEGELDLGEEVDDEEVEKIFDLSDVLTEEDEAEGPAVVETGPASEEKKNKEEMEEEVAADLEVDLDLEVN